MRPNRWATTARRLSGSSTSASSACIEPSTSARPSSSAKNGFPPAIQWTRTITGRGSAIPSRPHSSRWIAPTESGSIASRRNAAKARSSSSGAATGCPRTVARTATASPSSLRSMNVSTSAELASSHWASSSATSTGRSTASARTVESSATPRTRVSGNTPSGSRSSNAVSRACRCTGASRCTTPLNAGASRSPTAAKATCASDCVGRDRSTRKPRSPARRSASSQRTVFPIPASPSNSNACPPAGAAARNDSSASSSSRLPMISAAIAPFPRVTAPAGAPRVRQSVATLWILPGRTAIDRARKRDGQRAERVPNGVPNSADLGAQYPTKPDKAGLRRPENGETRPAHRRSTDSSRSTYWVRWRGPRKRSRTRLWASSPMRSAACGSSNSAVTRSPNA